MSTQSDTCTFCKIISGTLPARVVYDAGRVVAFLDSRPLFPGHVLVVPRKHIATLSEVGDDVLSDLFTAVRLLSDAVETALQSQGTFVALNNKVSQSVPHLHVHVVPRSKGDGLRGFFWPRNNYRDEDHAMDVQESIASEVERLLIR